MQRRAEAGTQPSRVWCRCSQLRCSVVCLYYCSLLIWVRCAVLIWDQCSVHCAYKHKCECSGLLELCRGVCLFNPFISLHYISLGQMNWSVQPCYSMYSSSDAVHFPKPLQQIFILQLQLQKKSVWSPFGWRTFPLLHLASLIFGGANDQER